MSIFADFLMPLELTTLDAAPIPPESPEQRENCVRNDLLTRLRGVCKDLPEQEFQDLVAAMTREQLRSERLH